MSKAMALSNWWEWGEWQGFEGDDAFHNVTCGFCSTRGGWKIVSQFAKTKDRKTLHFDTAQCPNCGNYVLAFWTTSVMGGRHSMHNVKQLPWPLDGKPEPSKEWPKQAANYWVQAHDNLRRENWEAAIMLARTALQSVARDKGAKSSKLKDEIDDLGNKSILPPNMIEWAHAVIRDPGNEMTHPAKDQPPANRKDARDVVGYLDFVLEYVYDLPKRIESFRNPEGK